MAIKVKVALDCEHLREQLRELIQEIVEDTIKNSPPKGPINNINVSNLSPGSQEIAQDIARLIYGSETKKDF